MIDNEMPNVGKGRSAEQIRDDLKRFVKRWHTDKGEAAGVRGRSEDIPVLHVLTQFVAEKKRGLKNLQKWPEYFETGMRVAFPALSPNQPERSVFLPKTPEEFFDLLEHIERNNTYPAKEFSLEEIARGKSEETDGDDENEGFVDETLEKFRTFVMTREKISDLTYALDLMDLYDDGQLQSIEFSKIFDERAYFLFVRAAWKAKTMEEVEPFLRDIEEKKEFKFYSERTRAQTLAAIRMRMEEIEKIEKEVAHVAIPPIKSGLPVSLEKIDQYLKPEMDRGARRHFVEQVRNASTLEEIESLDAEVNKFPFLNRGELGVVRSVLSRKREKLSQNEAVDK